MAISLGRIPFEILHKSINEVFKDCGFGEIIRVLDERYAFEGSFPQQSQDKKVLPRFFGKEKVFCNKIVVQRDLDSDTFDLVFGATFLAGRTPKSYISRYLKFAKNHDATLKILIEDNLSRLKYSRSIKEQEKITNLYRKKFSGYLLTFSSEELPFIVPDYIIAKVFNLKFDIFFNS